MSEIALGLARELPLEIAPLIFIFWFSITAVNGENAIGIGGSFSYLTFNSDNRPLKVLSGQFRIAVARCTGQIETRLNDGNTLAIKSFSKGRIYTVVRDKSTSDTFAGHVAEGNVPDDDGSFINYLWIAYCSACYLRERNGTAEPIWLLDDSSLRAEHFAMPVIWEPLSEDSASPRFVHYLNDGIFRGRNEFHERITMRFPPPLSSGFTNASFSVSEVERTAFGILPKVSQFTRSGVIGNSLFTRTITTMMASNVYLTQLRDDPRPEFVGIATILDNSFEHSVPQARVVYYSVTNGHWPPQAVLDVAQARRARMERLAEKPRNRSMLDVALSLSMIAVVLAPLIYFLQQRSNNTNHAK